MPDEQPHRRTRHTEHAEPAEQAEVEAPEARAEEKVETKAEEKLPAVRDEAPVPPAPVDPYKQVLNPYELPSNTAAAEAYQAANPGSVSEDAPISEERQAQATTAIEGHVETMAEAGVYVEDSRLPDQGPAPDPVLSSIDPTELPVGPPQNTTLTVNGENFLLETQIGFGVFSKEEADAGLGEEGQPKWERTTFVNSSTLTTTITQGLFPNPDSVPVVVGTPGGFVSESTDFTFVAPEEPEKAGASTRHGEKD
jgi:hypothetical protein